MGAKTKIPYTRVFRFAKRKKKQNGILLLTFEPGQFSSSRCKGSLLRSAWTLI